MDNEKVNAWASYAQNAAQPHIVPADAARRIAAALIANAEHFTSREALALMDKVDVLIRWAAVSHPDPAVYKEGAEAFWKVCHMIAGDDATRLAGTEGV